MGKSVRRRNARHFGPMNISEALEGPGAYVLLNRSRQVQYVGSSSNLRRRLMEHLRQRDVPDSRYFRIYRTRSTSEARRLERQLYRRYKPPYNDKEP